MRDEYMIKEEESYSIMDIKEVDPILEKYRKEVIEKYLEYEIVLLHEFRDEGKNLDDVIEHMKIALWYVKNQRAEQIKNKLGL
ncbi:MAG: hypothetical protein JSW62_03165 [Thermoplasmatales archaeon]|nr:MAG: hypothetical protein JSW62_03165 [Thermoplasmatales archaeon]